MQDRELQLQLQQQQQQQHHEQLLRQQIQEAQQQQPQQPQQLYPQHRNQHQQQQLQHHQQLHHFCVNNLPQLVSPRKEVEGGALNYRSGLFIIGNASLSRRDAISTPKSRHQLGSSFFSDFFSIQM